MSKSLVLKVVSADMKSYGGFQWPGVGGIAVAADWDASPVCGGGLHGWLNGVGYLACQSWSDDPMSKWLVLSVNTDTIVDIDGKVKFPKAEVVHVGDRKSASDVILATGFIGPVIGATVTGGDGATVTGGDGATVTGGDDATVTGGYGATVKGGDRATVKGGDGAKVTGGDGATVTGGYGATVKGGCNAVLSLIFYKGRRMTVIVRVGENGIRANTPYKLNDCNKFEEI